MRVGDKVRLVDPGEGASPIGDRLLRDYSAELTLISYRYGEVDGVEPASWCVGMNLGTSVAGGSVFIVGWVPASLLEPVQRAPRRDGPAIEHLEHVPATFEGPDLADVRQTKIEQLAADLAASEHSMSVDAAVEQIQATLWPSPTGAPRSSRLLAVLSFLTRELDELTLERDDRALRSERMPGQGTDAGALVLAVIVADLERAIDTVRKVERLLTRYGL